MAPRVHRASTGATLRVAALLLACPPRAALALDPDRFFGAGAGAGRAAAPAPAAPAAPALASPARPDRAPLPGQEVNAFGQPTYGVDVSFPIHHWELSENYAWLPHNAHPASSAPPRELEGKNVQYLGEKQKWYDEFLKGCEEHYGTSRGYSVCEETEKDRVEMSLRQPASMKNYTDLGFKKIKAPREVWEVLKKFWDDNGDQANWKDEKWPKGNTYTNHWAAPTYMVSVEDTQLRGAGNNLKRKIWKAAQDTIQEWVNHELTECSLYGIRVYTEGAILATHVDRMPLVSSAILNVAQDVDEPWPIEVYDHDGKAYNVTMEPGEMVLYESHSVLHGRPFPLKGRFYANIFIHFEPTGHSLRHGDHAAAAEAARGAQDKTGRAGGHEGEYDAADGLPMYILRDSEEDRRWHQQHPQKKRPVTFTTGSTPAHAAAQEGNFRVLEEVIDATAHLLDAKDANGWTPLHEGARGGHEEVVKFLVDRGADINQRTNEGVGGTPLYFSIQDNGADHPVSMLLASLGGLNIGPDL